MKLEPLRAALLAEVDGEERRRLAEVDRTCGRRLERVRRSADALTARARAEGERAAAQEARRRVGAASRRARELRLAAQRSLLEELHARALDALAARDDGAYRDLLARLGRRAREQLGSEAELEIDPPGHGGVRAWAGALSVDYTLPALVERAIAGLGTELEELWR